MAFADPNPRDMIVADLAYQIGAVQPHSERIQESDFACTASAWATRRDAKRNARVRFIYQDTFVVRLYVVRLDVTFG